MHFLFVYERMIFTKKPLIKRNDTDKSNELRVAGKKLGSQLTGSFVQRIDFLNHNQAPGQVRRPRRLGGRAGDCQGGPQGETPQGGANQQQPEVGPQGEMSGFLLGELYSSERNERVK